MWTFFVFRNFDFRLVGCSDLDLLSSGQVVEFSTEVTDEGVRDKAKNTAECSSWFFVACMVSGCFMNISFFHLCLSQKHGGVMFVGRVEVAHRIILQLQVFVEPKLVCPFLGSEV